MTVQAEYNYMKRECTELIKGELRGRSLASGRQPEVFHSLKEASWALCQHRFVLREDFPNKPAPRAVVCNRLCVQLPLCKYVLAYQHFKQIPNQEAFGLYWSNLYKMAFVFLKKKVSSFWLHSTYKHFKNVCSAYRPHGFHVFHPVSCLPQSIWLLHIHLVVLSQPCLRNTWFVIHCHLSNCQPTRAGFAVRGGERSGRGRETTEQHIVNSRSLQISHLPRKERKADLQFASLGISG